MAGMLLGAGGAYAYSTFFGENKNFNAEEAFNQIKRNVHTDHANLIHLADAQEKFRQDIVYSLIWWDMISRRL